MKLWTLPKFEYPATHQFEGTLFTRVTYAALPVTLGILLTVNFALVGYEPTAEFRNDFNATQKFWFHAFTGSPKPGSLCDRRVFRVGESLTTNASIFDWRIDAITRPNSDKSGVPYGGTVLDNCDISHMSLAGDVRTQSIDVVVNALCRGQGSLEVASSTKKSFSAFPSREGPLLRGIQFSLSDPVYSNLQHLFTIAVADMIRTWRDAMESNRTETVYISLSADIEFCPPIIGLRNDPHSPCASQTPQLNVTAARAVGGNVIVRQGRSPVPSFDSPYELDGLLQPPIFNLLHLVLAAVHIDLGNPSPNNFLAHPTPAIIDRTLAAVFPQTASRVVPSMLYTYLRQQSLLANSGSGPSVFDPLHVPGPSVVQATYLCNKFLKRKDTGNLIASILVATYGMFSTLWTVYITVAQWWIRKAGWTRSRLPDMESGLGERRETLSLVSTKLSDRTCMV